MIGFEDATFEWPTKGNLDTNGGEAIQVGGISSTQAFRVTNLHIQFHKNGLNAICRPSGSSKSSLLLALLEEMELLRGRVHLPVVQQPMEDDSLISSAAYYP